MDAGALVRELQVGRVPRLLLIHGPEPLLVDELVDRVTASVLGDPAAAAWNREVLDGDTAAPDAVVTAGLALPLFGVRRIVLVRGLAAAPARAVDRLRTAIEGARAQRGGWPGDGTTVVLVTAPVDRRAPALRLLPEAEQVEVRPPVGRAVVGWVRERARTAGLEVTPEAAQALVTLVGEDLSRLVGEIEKAGVFAGGDGRVGEDAVRALTGESRVRQYWELTQALEAGDRPAALRLLEELLVAGEEPLVLLGQIAGHVRDLWRVQAGLAGRADARLVARLLPRRRPDWAVERLMARAGAVRADGVVRAIRRCFEVELRLKSSGGDPRALLTMLVADVAGG